MEIRSTNRDDFRKVYDENYTLLVQVAMHIVYNQDIAEDLVQEAFERFFVKNMSFPGMDDAKYWLLRVTKNLALNHLKRNKRDLQLVEKVKKMPMSETASYVDYTRDVIEEEDRKRVRRAIEQLPENLKLVIQLKEYSDLDYKAIGKVLGISETNVKVRVHRARRKLESLYLWRIRMCIDLQMLSAYMDGELKEPYRTQVEEHLEHCATCRNILGNMKSLERTIQSDSFPTSELERNKDVIYKKLDNKFFSNGNKISFFRRRIQMKVPTMIASAAAATFIFVGAFVLFGTNSSETSDILPSFNVNAESENVRYVSNRESLDNYSLEEILQYLDSKGYNVDISIKGLQPLEVTEMTQTDEGSVN